MFSNSGFDVSLFHRGDDLTKLKQYDIIITATGVPGLISSSMLKPGATLVDAGTASEDGVLKGDASDEVRARTDLKAITPIKGGVGPLTVTCLFEHVIQAAR
jgi:methylenetetrahydrofolate dehydrogenase (NADP+)/methenyltetrahydrofolate cyclohydrolase